MLWMPLGGVRLMVTGVVRPPGRAHIQRTEQYQQSDRNPTFHKRLRVPAMGLFPPVYTTTLIPVLGTFG